VSLKPVRIKGINSMKKARTTFVASLFIAAFVLFLPASARTQNREKFVISARAGGVNAVTGRATMRPHGNLEWRQLTIKEDLEAGDVVSTGLDGRVEMLLNPGSYMRIGENSEVELADNSLENLEVRLIKGTAIVEVTGADDENLFIGITTPHTRMSIIRRGLYRVNVVPGDTTELIVRKGRVMLDGSHTKVKGGNKVVFSGSSFSVAKLEKGDKKDSDTLESWSKDRAQTLARANSKIPGRTLMAFASSFRNDWSYTGLWRRSGFWLFNPAFGCYTFLPFGYGWGSPYGGSYSSFFYGGGSGPFFGRPVVTGTGGGYPPGYGTSGSGGRTVNPPSSPSPPRSSESPRMDRGQADSPGSGEPTLRRRVRE
jgi:hypothetical protein